MTAAAVMARETALADIRRRGVSNHPYQTDLPSIASLRRAHPQTQRRACEDVAAELTAWDRDTRRHGVAESTLAAAGLAEVLLLIVRGHREIGLHEIAAIMRGHRNTAQGVISRLCGTKLLWTRVQGGVTRALQGTTLQELVEFGAPKPVGGGGPDPVGSALPLHSAA